MKKCSILLMVFVLCLCAGCGMRSAPGGSATLPETDLFETHVNSVNRSFIAETDSFRYLSGLNRGLAEIDKETGDIVWYPGKDTMFDLVILRDGRVVSETEEYNDATGIATVRVVADDLYGNTEVLFELEDGFVLHQSLVGDHLYSYTNAMDLVRTDLNTMRSETIMTTESLIRYMLVDENGIWYSDDCGLYYRDRDSENAELVIDECVGYIQKIGSTVYFLIHGKNGIFAYDIRSAEYGPVYDLDVSLFVITEDKKTLYAVGKNGKDLFRFDIGTGQEDHLTAPCEIVTDFNIVNGRVYALGYTGSISFYDPGEWCILQIDGDQLYQVIA